MKLKIIILISFFSLYLAAQKEDYIWYFGCNFSNFSTPTAGLDFNSGVPVPLLNSVMPCTEGCATQSDRNGNLLFYTNGTTVWDRTHSIMMNGLAVGGHTSAEQSAQIIPFPNDTTKFYVFCQDGYPTCPGTGLHYSIIDMTLNGGLGGITAPKAILLQKGTCEWLSACKHINGTDYWVVTSDYDSTRFYSYQVSSLGISSPIITNFPYITSSNFKLDFNTKGDQIVFKATSQPTPTVVYNVRYLADFNQSNGVVSNFITLDSLGNNDGTAFSPNDSLLYAFSYVPTLTNTVLYQYNVKSPNIFQNKNIIGYFSGGPHIGMKLGPDKKIYCSSGSPDSLDIIHFPNIVGTGCNFQTKALYLGGRKIRFMLPNYSFPLAKYPLTINQTIVNNIVSLFPNPNLNSFSVKSATRILSYSIQDLSGKELLYEVFKKSSKDFEIKHNLEKGIYIISFEDYLGKKCFEKFVVN
ncbi:MAG: T9SS type A sorting domain-containing protein [Bacteroidia bacterium]|nr:T9SS type A sorting domain-containing protein [Bacteroidia bacterium]